MANERVYNVGKTKLLDGSGTWLGTTIGVLALGTLPTTASQGYDPDVATVTALLALSGCAEASGTGYARKTLASKTATQDNTNDRVALDAADITFTAANGWTLRALVVYLEVAAADATRYPIAYFDTGLPVTGNGGDIVYSWNSVGLITLT